MIILLAHSFSQETYIRRLPSTEMTSRLPTIPMTLYRYTISTFKCQYQRLLHWTKLKMMKKSRDMSLKPLRNTWVPHKEVWIGTNYVHKTKIGQGWSSTSVWKSNKTKIIQPQWSNAVKQMMFLVKWKTRKRKKIAVGIDDGSNSTNQRFIGTTSINTGWSSKRCQQCITTTVPTNSTPYYSSNHIH